jgi:hypothetical protein
MLEPHRGVCCVGAGCRLTLACSRRRPRYIVPPVRLSAPAVALLTTITAACASEPPMLRGQPIRKPVAILVRISDEAARTDQLAGTATLVETVSTGLSNRGVQNQIFAADDDNPPPPRIELWIEKWDAGAPGERATASLVAGLIGELATIGKYAVVCRIYR